MNTKSEELRRVLVTSHLGRGRDVLVLGELGSAGVADLRRNGFRVLQGGDRVDPAPVATVLVAGDVDVDDCWDAVSKAQVVVLHGPDANAARASERRLRLCGFRTHPRLFKYCSYHDDPTEWPLFVGIRDEVPDGDLLSRPLAEASFELRRLSFVSLFVRPGDRVRVVGGSPDHARVLAAASTPSRVCSDDEDWLEASCDFVLHVDGRKADFAEQAERAAKALTPGGRFATISPVERGEEILASIRRAGLVLEKTFSQDETTGRLVEAGSCGADIRGDWFMVVAGTDPLSGSRDGFVDTIYPFPDPTANLLSFARDYENPWLMRSFFGMSVRTENRQERLEIARRVEAASERIDADRGSALCVRGYDLLASGSDAERAHFMEAARVYLDGSPESPHALRWQVSIAFLCGLLLQELDDHDGAVEMYRRVIGMPWADFSPTLGTKPAEAAYRAGIILFRSGDVTAARRFWQKGVAVARVVLDSSFDEVVGDMECPLPDAFPESIHAMSLARKCADCLRSTYRSEGRPEAMIPEDERRTLAARLADSEAQRRLVEEWLRRSQSEDVDRSLWTRAKRRLKDLLGK